MNAVLFLAGLTMLLGIGVLVGSGLHSRGIDQKYRRLAQCVRHLNAREAALDARSHPAAICGSCPLEILGTILVREPSAVNEDED